MLESSTTINLYTMMGPYQLRVEWESEAEAGKLVGLWMDANFATQFLHAVFDHVQTHATARVFIGLAIGRKAWAEQQAQ